MHTTDTVTTPSFKLTFTVATTLDGHTEVSLSPDIWERLVQTLRVEGQAALRAAQHALDYEKALRDA
jgi:hypothetical protein